MVEAPEATKNAIKIGQAKGRPMLSWVGKHPLRDVVAFPGQAIEQFAMPNPIVADSDWTAWPTRYGRGGLLFHGDNKEVLAHLIANGFRGMVNLVYIDPPFDSAANYVRRVQLRGASGTARFEGEGYTLGEQIQYTDIWANDSYLQFMYERLQLLKELLADNGSIWLHCDWHRSHVLRCILDEVFGPASIQNEVIWQRTDPHNDAVSRLGWIHDTLYWYCKGEKPFYNWRAVAEPLSDAALKEYSLIMLDESVTVPADAPKLPPLRGQPVIPYAPNYDGLGRRFKLDDCTWKGNDPSHRFTWRKTGKPSDKRVWPYASPEEMDAALDRGEFYLRNPAEGAARCRVSFLDKREGQLLQTIWTEAGRMKGGVEYPTEKPEALLSRIIEACTRPGDLVLDCFVGSGTTAAVAQRLGRRWIACDINKGAVQVTTKRLIDIMTLQSRSSNGQAELLSDDAPPKPAQLSFMTFRVNDYDLAIQHAEAVNLACEHIGVVRTRTDAFFDGTLGKELVKIVSFDHPASPADLDGVAQEIRNRPDEDRDIVVVSLGKELACDPWLLEHNRKGAPNKIRLVELRSDPKYGQFFAHEPASADVRVSQQDGLIRVEIQDFISPTIVTRLQQQAGIVAPQIDDWRVMVDSVMIDGNYDGSVFRVSLADVPEKQSDLVAGSYDLAEVSGGLGAIAVKITDMLGEEVLVAKQVV